MTDTPTGHDPIANLHAACAAIRVTDSAHMLRITLLLLQRATNKRGPLWSTVSEVTMHGSEFSKEICRALGMDPDAEFDKDTLDQLQRMP